MIGALKDQASTTLKKIGYAPVGQDTITVDEWDKKMTEYLGSQTAVERTQNIAQTAEPHYADEIPPFDITISFANEYGQKAVLVIYGCEILNEGSGFSIDSVTTEKAATFVARRVDSLKKVED